MTRRLILAVLLLALTLPALGKTLPAWADPSLLAVRTLKRSLGREHLGQTTQDWGLADRATVRLQPASFPTLPRPIRVDLERRGCLVPQSDLHNGPHNVVYGRFTTAKDRDVAVLCSISGVSSILVYVAGSTDAVKEIEKQADRRFLQGMGGGRIVYSRALAVADPAYMELHYKRYGGPTPPPMDHDGIEDAFLGKASQIWYWYQNRWWRLQGAD